MSEKTSKNRKITKGRRQTDAADRWQLIQDLFNLRAPSTGDAPLLPQERLSELALRLAELSSIMQRLSYEVTSIGRPELRARHRTHNGTGLVSGIVWEKEKDDKGK